MVSLDSAVREISGLHPGFSWWRLEPAEDGGRFFFCCLMCLLSVKLAARMCMCDQCCYILVWMPISQHQWHCLPLTLFVPLKDLWCSCRCQNLKCHTGDSTPWNQSCVARYEVLADLICRAMYYFLWSCIFEQRHDWFVFHFWSSFSDIFDVDHFISVLEGDISIVKELPGKYSWSTREYYATGIRDTRIKMAPVHASANWYLENVLPILQRSVCQISGIGMDVSTFNWLLPNAFIRW